MGISHYSHVLIFFKQNKLSKSMKVNLIILIITLILMTACSNPKKTENKVNIIQNTPIHINLPGNKHDEFCKASYIADTVYYVPLETNVNSFLGDIRLITINESYIIVSDKSKILAFQRDGKFIGQVGKTGNGPGELSRILNFLLKDDTLYVTSTGKYGISKYTVNGKYLGFIEQKFQMMYFTNLENGGYIWFNREKGDIVYFNNKWEISDTLQIESVSKKRGIYTYGSTDDKHLIKYKNQILFTNYRNDTIYEVASKRKNPSIIFNLKDKLLPDEIQFENIIDDEIFRKKAKPYQRINFFQTDSFVFILQRSWTDNLPPLFYTYSRTNDVLKQYTNPFIYDDFVLNTILPISFYDCKHIISVITTGHFKKAYEKGASSGSIVHRPKRLLKVNENDNPVIAIVRTK